MPEAYHSTVPDPASLHRKRFGSSKREYFRLGAVLAFALLVLLLLVLWKARFDSALLQESRAGNLAGVEKWLSLGADPNARDSDGTTPLMHAAAGGHLATVRLLIRNTADPTLRSKSGLTARALAAGRHQTNVVAFLTRLGVE